jgi:hypothetical protein
MHNYRQEYLKVAIVSYYGIWLNFDEQISVYFRVKILVSSEELRKAKCVRMLVLVYTMPPTL